MPDLCPLVALLTFGYGASIVGLASGLALRAWFCRQGRAMPSNEAALCALMPLIALVVLLIAVRVLPEEETPFIALHHAWHTWADTIRTLPAIHSALHEAHVFVLICALFFVSRTVLRFAQMGRLVISLHNAPGNRLQFGEVSVYCLRASRHLCFTVGVLRPRIYVSTSLLEQLSLQHRDAMFSHEAAHVRRRDGLMNALLLMMRTLLPLPGSRLLYQDWQKAAERACDADAVRAIGDPCDVASALVEVTRLVGKQSVPGAAFFGSPEDVEARVHSLLNMPVEPAQTPYYAGFLLYVTLNIALFVAAATWVRHLAELFVYH